MMEILLALVIANIAVTVISTLFIIYKIADADYCAWAQYKELKEKIDNKKDRCVCPICLKEFRRG